MDMFEILKKIQEKAKIINNLDENFNIEIKIRDDSTNSSYYYKNNEKIEKEIDTIDWIWVTLVAKIKKYNYTFSINKTMSDIGTIDYDNTWYTEEYRNGDIEETFEKLDDLINNMTVKKNAGE